MVLASGGIAIGADVAETLAQGAEGVWVGTRMVASTEAFAHPEYKRRLLVAHGRATAVTTGFGPEYPNVPYRVLRTDLVKRIAGREDEIPSPQPGDPPIGETILFPFTLRVPYTMPPFSAVVPTPDTNGQFDLMGLPAGEESVRKIMAVKPAADIVAEMMIEAREIPHGGASGHVKGLTVRRFDQRTRETIGWTRAQISPDGPTDQLDVPNRRLSSRPLIAGNRCWSLGAARGTSWVTPSA